MQTMQTSNESIDTIDRTPKYTPIESILELRNKKLTLKQVGKILGISKQAVSRRLKDYEPIFQRIEQFKRGRADILTLKQSELINSLTDKDIKSASLLQRTTAFGILYDKERLERGQSTENISVKSLVSSISSEYDQLRKRKEELLRQIDSCDTD